VIFAAVMALKAYSNFQQSALFSRALIAFAAMSNDEGWDREREKTGVPSKNDIPTWYRRPWSEKMVICLSYPALPIRKRMSALMKSWRSTQMEKPRSLPDMIAVCDIITQEKKTENNEICDPKEVGIGIERKRSGG
jgi:hypothetical protein